MVVAAWILLVAFGIIAFHGLVKFLVSRLNWFHALIWIFSVFVSAISAGIIWGGLFQ